MVRLSRFAFDDSRDSDDPRASPAYHFDDPDCDDPGDHIVLPPNELTTAEDEDQDSLMFDADDDRKQRDAA